MANTSSNGTPTRWAFKVQQTTGAIKITSQTGTAIKLDTVKAVTLQERPVWQSPVLTVKVDGKDTNITPQTVWQDIVIPLEDGGKLNTEYLYDLSAVEARSIKGLCEWLDSVTIATVPIMPPTVAPVVKSTPAPMPLPTNDSGPLVINGAAPVMMSSLANHTATVTAPADYQGGTKQRKPRKRKTDSTIVELYDDIRSYSRAYALDALENRVRSLQGAKAFVSGKVKRMTYDIPSKIRAEIIEPTSVLRCIGFMPTESELIARAESLESPLFVKFLGLLSRYAKGTENAARLGCCAKWRITGIAYEDVNELKEEVSEELSETLIATHTSLIVGLGQADDELKEALAAAEPTEREMVLVQAARDNAYRACLRTAHEELNLALKNAQEFDHDGNVDHLLEALRNVLVSRRNTFNAETQRRGAKGVEL